MSTVTDATTLAQRFADRMVAALEAHDIDAIVALYAENGTQIHPFADGIVVGLEAIREGDGALVRAFPDVEVDVRSTAAVGQTVIIEATLRMTHAGPLDLEDGTSVPPSGRRVELPLVWVCDIDADEQIVQERSYLDSAAFFRQLGLA